MSKKIVYITTNIYDAGGVSSILCAKINYLIQKWGYKITIVNTYIKKEAPFFNFHKEVMFVNTKSYKNKLIRIINFPKELKQIINEIQPDIIINADNGFKGFFIPWTIKGEAPIIYENHLRKATINLSFKDKINNVLFAKVKKIALSRFHRVIQYFPTYCTQPNETVIPNFLILTPENELHSPSKTVLTIGRISYEKNFDALLHIWAKAIKNAPDWKLQICCKGNTSPLKKIASKLNIENTVVFLKPQKNVKQLYTNASIYVNTSRYETFGLTVLEALSFGLPTLGFNVGDGPSFLIEEGVNGFLIKPYSIEEYAKKLTLLMLEEDLRTQMREKAIEMKTKYNKDEIMLKWHQLLQSL